MFTEAASLWYIVRWGSCRTGDAWTLPRHLPSVVVIAIDVKHLVSLDTENTVYQNNDKQDRSLCNA
jgi:hypothetical protein